MNSMIKKAIGWSALVCVIAIGGFFVIHSTTGSTGAETAAASPDSYKLLSPDVIEADDDALKTAGVSTTITEAHDHPVTLTLTARSGLDMEHVTHVHAQFGGKVKEVKPELGAEVQGPGSTTRPTVLCVIESNDLAQAKAGYLQAKVQVKIDEDNLRRTKELWASKVLADKSLQDAQSTVTKDAALLDAARQQLLVFGLTQPEIDQVDSEQGRQRMDYVITSPRTGVVAEKGVSGGEIADPTINLFTIADTSTMWVWGDVYERDLDRIKVGDKATVVFTSDPEHPRSCTIDWISPQLDPNTHSIRVRGSIDNQNGRRLLADMYATMRVETDPGLNAIVIPSSAVVRVGNDAFVFVQVASGGEKTQFRKTPVTAEAVGVGFGTADTAVFGAPTQADQTGSGVAQVRITKGLEPGQSIVSSGALGLFNEMSQHAN
jgi:cobalt-zinc-cadmium efflux system membrane fusion protein